jgi:hypothetical protein
MNFAAFEVFRHEERVGANGIEIFEGKALMLESRNDTQPVKIIHRYADGTETSWEYTQFSI